MVWGDNSEICLKLGGGVIKESLLKLLNREGGQRHLLFVRGRGLEDVTTPAPCKISIVHQVLTHFNFMFCKFVPI